MENPKINLEKKMQGNAESQSSPRIPIEIRPTSGNKLLHEMQRKQAPQEKSPKFAMENPKINLEKKMQGNAERQSSPRIPIENSLHESQEKSAQNKFAMENPKINLEKKMQGNAERRSSPRIPIEIRPTSFLPQKNPRKKKHFCPRSQGMQRKQAHHKPPIESQQRFCH